MRILGYVGTYNEDVRKAVRALLEQSRPLDEILLVDNASAEDVLPTELLDRITVIRVERNIGPNSAVRAGLEYALAKGYDWIWLSESDAAAHKDALEKLIQLYESFDPETRRAIGVLSSTQVMLPSGKLFQGRRLTPGGPRLPRIDPRLPYCEVDSMNWNGILVDLEAVKAIGLPRSGKEGHWQDLSYDYGDVEYTYRIRRTGRRVLVHRFSLVDQRVGRSTSLRILGGLLISTNHAPARRYIFFRNLVFFWVHVYRDLNWPLWLLWFCYRLSVTILGILLLEKQRAGKILACFRGIRAGLAQDLETRY